jgi:type VI secretion system protein ImpH
VAGAGGREGAVVTDPDGASAPRAGSALARLTAKPRRFGFDAAVRLLMHAKGIAEPADAVRFRAPLGSAYAGTEVHAVTTRAGNAPILTTPVMGLTGPTGVMPRHYSDILHISTRNRSPALRDFLELVAQRFVGHFARAGMKYRPHRVVEAARLAQDRAGGDRPGPDSADAIDPVARILLAFIGYGTPHLLNRVAAGSDALLHYAGILSMRPRSAERLQVMLSDWLGRKVEIVQLVGDWLSLPPDQRTRMPLGRRGGVFNQLGVDAAIGVRAWDIQARVLLRIGPLDQAGFAALLPDRPLLRQLVSLTRAFLGFETGFAVNLVLAAPEIPVLRLGGGSPPARLGWNTWAPKAKRDHDAAEAIFTAELVESDQAGQGVAPVTTRTGAMP